jgi:hypothetical protein
MKYSIDFDSREYFEIKTRKFRSESEYQKALDNWARDPRSHTVSPVVVKAQTVETDQPRTLLGHTARHFVTTVGGIPITFWAGSGISDRVIDGWYVADMPQPSTTCIPEYRTRMNPNGWLGVSFLPGTVEMPEIEHVGPTPSGLTAKLEITDRIKSADADKNINETIDMTVDVLDYSDAPLNPAIFEVPPGFKEVAAPPGYRSLGEHSSRLLIAISALVGACILASLAFLMRRGKVRVSGAPQS